MSAQLSSLVVSKLDRLQSKAQRLLKLGAVVGGVFSASLLTRLAQRVEQRRLERRASASTSLADSSLPPRRASTTEDDDADNLSSLDAHREDEVAELLDELCSRNWLRHVYDGAQYRFVDDKQRQIVYELLLFDHRQYCK
jgi:predicted ATPase